MFKISYIIYQLNGKSNVYKIIHELKNHFTNFLNKANNSSRVT